MQVLAVDLALMRDVLLPGLRLTPGRAVMARVLDPGSGGRGTLSIAGYALGAELPRGMRAGQELRLEVREVNATRVLLAVAQPRSAETPAAPVADTAIPLPGGVTLRVMPDGESDTGRGAGAGGGYTVALALDGPGLGPLQLRVALDPASLQVSIGVGPGEPLARAQAERGALREALSAVGEGRAVSVTVTPRREPLDVYA